MLTTSPVASTQTVGTSSEAHQMKPIESPNTHANAAEGEGALPNEKAPSAADSVTVRSAHGADVEKADGGEPPVDDREAYYVDGYKLFVIFIGMLLSIFLVALDQTIGQSALARDVVDAH